MQPDINSVPLYQAIANALKSAIRQGQYPVGGSLPTEKLLCQEYSASRHTVREALRQLSDLGMITRKQGSGTRVQSIEPRLKFIQHVSSIDELLKYGAETRFEILTSTKIRANDELATLLDCRRGELCLHLHGIRYSTHHIDPVCITEVFMRTEHGGPHTRFENLKQAVFEIRRDLDLARLGRVEQNITAITIDSDAAQELRVDPGTAALKTTRRYFDTDNSLFLACSSVHPGTRFSYDATLTRDLG